MNVFSCLYFVYESLSSFLSSTVLRYPTIVIYISIYKPISKIQNKPDQIFAMEDRHVFILRRKPACISLQISTCHNLDAKPACIGLHLTANINLTQPDVKQLASACIRLPTSTCYNPDENRLASISDRVHERRQKKKKIC